MGEFRKQKCVQVMLIAIIHLTHANKFQGARISSATNRPDYELASCTNRKTPQGFRTFCEHLSVLFLPADLSPRTEILVIENSIVENLDKASAKRYPNIVEFSFVGFTYGKSLNRVAVKMSEDFFLAFPLLEKINMTDVIIPYIVKQFIHLPTKVKSVAITNVNVKDGMLKLMDLPDLYELNLELNNLTRVPQVNRKSPIIRLNLRNNPIKEIIAKQLAVYCQLREFFVSQSTDLDKLLDKNCECNRMTYYFNTKRMTVDWWPRCTDESCKVKESVPKDITNAFERCRKISLNISVDENFEDEGKNSTEVVPTYPPIVVTKYLFLICILAILTLTAAIAIYIAWTGRKKSEREPKSVAAVDDEIDMEGDVEEENEIT